MKFLFYYRVVKRSFFFSENLGNLPTKSFSVEVYFKEDLIEPKASNVLKSDNITYNWKLKGISQHTVARVLLKTDNFLATYALLGVYFSYILYSISLIKAVTYIKIIYTQFVI